MASIRNLLQNCNKFRLGKSKQGIWTFSGCDLRHFCVLLRHKYRRRDDLADKRFAFIA